MKFQIDPFVFRLVLALIAVPATALAVIGLAKLKDRADERRVVDYVRHVQPQLAADLRFKYLKLEGTHVFGCVSNSEVLASLKSFFAASKPPVPVSFSLVRTNASDWAEQEEHERLMEMHKQARELVVRSDAFLEVFSDSVRFYKPENTNLISSLPQFQAAVASLRHRDRAVIAIPAVGYDTVTNEAAHAAAMLKQCGFKEVRFLTTHRGFLFPYTAL